MYMKEHTYGSWTLLVERYVVGRWDVDISADYRRFGLVGVMVFGIDGLRISGCVWSRHCALGLGEVQDDKEPDEYKQNELIDKMV